MQRTLKVVTIGGGSSYTPELMEGFIKRYDELKVREIWLVDIEDGKEKVEIIAKLARRMWKKAGLDVKIYHTLDRREALKDADYVTTQFRVGLLNARIKDERIPLLHNMLGQETNGAGGNFKAFRTIPVIKEIIEDMRELCPNAWLINFTNPSGIITETVIKHLGWKKCIGLCNVPTIAMKDEPEAIGAKAEDLNYIFFGLNHFHWHKVYDKRGNELTDKIIEVLNEKNAGLPSNIFSAKFPQELLRSMHMIPCGYHRYYYMYREMLDHSIEEFKKEGTRAEQMKEVERKLFEIYKDENLDVKPKELEKRGGKYYSEAACECISAIENDKNIRMVVSTENRGALPDLESNSIVEVSSLIGADGAKPLAVGKLHAQERGWLQVMKAKEECLIEAALNGDYGKAMEAFTVDPMVENGENSRLVLDKLFLAHEKYLPQFKEAIEDIKKKNIKFEDEVVIELMEKGL